MAKFRKLDVVALPVPVYNVLINFLQDIRYREVAPLLQQIAATMRETTIRVEIPQPAEPEPKTDPASGDEESE